MSLILSCEDSTLIPKLILEQTMKLEQTLLHKANLFNLQFEYITLSLI